MLGQAVPTRAATAAVDAQRRMVRRRRPTGRLGQPSRPDRRAAQPRRAARALAYYSRALNVVARAGGRVVAAMITSN